MFDEQIASDFVQMFPETRESLRTVGREAEYVVVNSHGFAVDIEPLLITSGLLRTLVEL